LEETEDEAEAKANVQEAAKITGTQFKRATGGEE
jgi:hypothetical protein